MRRGMMSIIENLQMEFPDWDKGPHLMQMPMREFRLNLSTNLDASNIDLMVRYLIHRESLDRIFLEVGWLGNVATEDQCSRMGTAMITSLAYMTETVDHVDLSHAAHRLLFDELSIFEPEAMISFLRDLGKCGMSLNALDIALSAMKRNVEDDERFYPPFSAEELKLMRSYQLKYEFLRRNGYGGATPLYDDILKLGDSFVNVKWSYPEWK